MGFLFQILFLTFTGLFLLWLGYTLFFVFSGASTPSKIKSNQGNTGSGNPDLHPVAAHTPKACPVCLARLETGERVKSIPFPSMDGKERFMHISGCYFCLEGDRHRICPVCGEALEKYEYLVARYYEKPMRNHVHVIGCTRCKQRKV